MEKGERCTIDGKEYIYDGMGGYILCNQCFYNCAYYNKNMPTCKVDVLGTEYNLFLGVPESEDENLKNYSGYCDKTSHKIVVADKPQDCNLDDYISYRKQVMRHELIHAFMFESGLGGDSVWHVDGQEHPEQTVDWIARQFPKMLKAFQTVGAL